MNTLHVITDRQWMRNELAANTVIPTRAGFGLDIPAHATDDAWWIPQGIATRLKLNGVNLHPQAPGPDWLPALPLKYTGREVQTLTASEVSLLPATMPARFWKFAEAKIDTFQAGIQPLTDVKAFLASQAIPPNAKLQHADPLNLGNEWRTYVHNGKITTASIYLTHKTGQALTYYDYPDEDPVERGKILDLATEVAAHIVGPDAYTLDIAITAAGEPIVLEANPAWCSAWYGCDIDAVVQAVITSCTPNPTWGWEPDPYLLARYQPMRPLRHA